MERLEQIGYVRLVDDIIYGLCRRQKLIKLSFRHDAHYLYIYIGNPAITWKRLLVRQKFQMTTTRIVIPSSFKGHT
jgi:hypothetical protein